MFKRLSIISTQCLVCLAASAAVVSMLQLDRLNSLLAGGIIFCVLMIFSARVTPEHEADAKRHAAEASSFANYQTNRSPQKNEPNNDADGSDD
jgi:hypothetical protein